MNLNGKFCLYLEKESVRPVKNKKDGA